MRIFHVTTALDWNAAAAHGMYTRSTIGRDLADVGFIHAAYAHQLSTIRQGYVAEACGPLVLLEIETDLLHSQVVEEQPAPGTEVIYPHIYGPLNTDAVVRASALGPEGAEATGHPEWIQI